MTQQKSRLGLGERNLKLEFSVTRIELGDLFKDEESELNDERSRN